MKTKIEAKENALLVTKHDACMTIHDKEREKDNRNSLRHNFKQLDHCYRYSLERICIGIDIEFIVRIGGLDQHIF